MQNYLDHRQSVADQLIDSAEEPVFQNVSKIIDKSKLVLSETEISELTCDISTEITGLGSLSKLITDDVTDILVNNYQSVWTDGTFGLRQHLNIFRDDTEIAQLARRLAALCNMRLDDSQPFVDGMLPDGVRLHALLPPISGNCAKISLRFPNAKTIPISKWVEDLDSKSIELVESVTSGEASFVISGETGSGKTTLLKSILSMGKETKRIILLEDSPEINLELPNLVSLSARKPNTEGRGEITLENLVKQCLRMRPDAIVVGEIRGREALEFLLAVSSGHIGSGTTIHSHLNNVLNRFNLLTGLAGVSNEFSRDLFYSTIDVVIQCGKTSSGRKIVAVKSGSKC